MTNTRIMLGRGRLNWPGSERRSDRYGLVTLLSPPPDGTQRGGPMPVYGATLPWAVALPVGRRGRLIAVAVETRESEHIGDLFRGIGPTTPDVGEEIVLGAGEVFAQEIEGLYVGLRPDDGRDSDWLDPRALYRAHDQTVDLFFEPEPLERGGR